ncbi:MAG: uroporphyrinogen decarboxylase family protein [Phycisphaerae bacterium]|jgi:uroporphyrinogen decarboxylase
MTPKERVYATLQGKPRDRVPVTPIFMAWAAHYIGRAYRDFYLDPAVLSEAQQAVTEAFGVDQISAISDPWRETEGYGMKFDYPPEGVGRPLGHVIQEAADAGRLPRLDIATCPRMQHRVQSVAAMSASVGRTHSVLGWIEGPLAEYVDLRGMQEAMMDLLDRPEMFMVAARTILANALAFARAQIKAGADMIGVGDAAASLVGPELYVRYVLPLQQELIAGIHEAGAAVKLHICGNIRAIISDMARTGAEVIDVDWMVPLDLARAAVGDEVTLCGNFDPSAILLSGSSQQVAQAARHCIERGGDRFILMPGCEVPPGTPEANIRAFCPSQGCLITEDLKKS